MSIFVSFKEFEKNIALLKYGRGQNISPILNKSSYKDSQYICE